MPGTAAVTRDNAGHPEGSLRHLLLNFNKLVADLDAIRNAFAGDEVLIATALSRGSTDTQLATTQTSFTIGGVPVTKAAVAAGTAFGALGTVPADTWAIIAVDVIAAGTISYASGAANYSTGYATEALAIAALPAKIQAKARLGYITIKTKVATAFVVGTDGLAGGSTANFASATNYYPTAGVMQATGAATNGILIPTVLSRGSTDTNLASTAFSYNIGGVPQAKAAVAAGTAFGALGTVPIDKWAIIAAYIDVAGVVSFVSGALNYTTGYDSEGQAITALPVQQAGKSRMGYITLKTKAATAFVVGTDALFGGASGNVAAKTNYYPTAGFSAVAGIQAAQLTDDSGVVFTV